MIPKKLKEESHKNHVTFYVVPFLFMSFLLLVFTGDETYQDIFQDFTHMASNDPDKLNRYQQYDSQRPWHCGTPSTCGQRGCLQNMTETKKKSGMTSTFLPTSSSSSSSKPVTVCNVAKAPSQQFIFTKASASFKWRGTSDSGFLRFIKCAC